MKYVDEFRAPERVHRLAAALAKEATRPWTVMEICGGQTHAIARYALDALLPDHLQLVHGPGCPVCVTPSSHIRLARELSLRDGTVLGTFADMLRVPCPEGDLLSARAEGGRVQVVQTPLDLLRLAREQPGQQVVFFSVGFETTAPAAALLVLQAQRMGLGNLAVLASHVRVPPAMAALLADPAVRIDGFVAAGHVCTVEGTQQYADLAERHGVPIVATGFEPVDILQGLHMVVRQLERGEARVDNQYTRAVVDAGNLHARTAVDQVFEYADAPLRGLGVLPAGGLRLREAFRHFDALQRFGLQTGPEPSEGECRAAEVLRGQLKPTQCEAFGTRCTPERPLGAPMVSSEGACAAYHRFRRPLSVLQVGGPLEDGP